MRQSLITRFLLRKSGKTLILFIYFVYEIENHNSDQTSELEKMTEATFIDRLKSVLSGGSVLSFAKRCEMPESTIRNYLKGGMPTLDNIVTIAKTADVNIEWLVTGEGPMRAGQDIPALRTSDVIPGEMKLVPRLDVRAAAGNGSLNHAEDTVGMMAFQASWLMEHGINPNFARVLTATGDSMKPTIRDGDLLVVDTSIDSLVNHGIYVVIYAGLLLVKRVTRRIDGSIVIRSDNRNLYDDEIVAADATVELIIAGRVCWAGRTL